MLLHATLLVLSQALSASLPASPPLVTGKTTQAAGPAVAGRVVTEFGEPLPGVYVAVQGTPQATSTNSSGDFLVTVPTMNSVLVFKCQGYREQTLTLANSNALTVKMYSVTRPGPGAAVGEDASGKPKVLSVAEVMPTYPGGEAAYLAYIRQNARFPEEAQSKKASGVVFVGFVIDEQGRVVDADIVKGAGNGFDQEALRLVRLMPWWNPGMMAGKPVRVSKVIRLPFQFRERD